MTATLSVPALLAPDPEVAELLPDLQAAGITSFVIPAPLYADPCGVCRDRDPGDLDAGRVFEAVADVLHHCGGFADCATPVCALCLWAEVAWWVRHGRIVTVRAYAEVLS